MRKALCVLTIAAIATMASATPPPGGGSTATGSGPQASARPPKRPVQPASQASSVVRSGEATKRGTAKPK